MERTIEEIYKQYLGIHTQERDGLETVICSKGLVLKAMKAYAKQERGLAVEKALDVASENATVNSFRCVFSPNFHTSHVNVSEVNKQSILSLKPQIMEELNNGE